MIETSRVARDGGSGPSLGIGRAATDAADPAERTLRYAAFLGRPVLIGRNVRDLQRDMDIPQSFCP